LKRRVFGMALIAVLLLSMRSSPLIPRVESTTTNITVSADADVSYNDPDTNYGNSSFLCVTSLFNTECSYLKFFLSGLPSGIYISNAKMWLRTSWNSQGDPNIVDAKFVSNDSWAESTITWNNKPSLGSILSSTSVTSSNTWYSWDVTTQAQIEYNGDKILSIGMSTGGDLKMFLSKDYGRYSPYLEVTYGPCTVDHPYMPPEILGDINCDGMVNYTDEVLFVDAYIAYWTPGGECDPRCDFDKDGDIDYDDICAFVTAYIVFWNNGGIPEAPPVAYSTTFEFTVPDDGGYEVWYYVLARVYVPPGLSGQGFSFVASADDRVQSVKLDGVSKAGSGSSININWGTLNNGYHLLEFEFVEVAAAGSLNFHVATAGGDHAWLPRFRIYVPNHSDNEYKYTVKTQSNFPISDTFFLKGYADDFIDDLKLGGGLIWQDWEWDMGPAYGATYAWGDGFMYPLGYLDPAAWRDVEFSFGEIWAAGLLDFQIISWTNQQSRMGKPGFYCKAENPVVLHSPLQINYSNVYGGSEWHSEAGTSWRSISATYEISVYKPPDDENPEGHDAVVRFTISLVYLDYESPKGTTTDFAIAFNITHLCAHLGDPNPPFPLDAGFEVPDSEDYGIHVYAPEQAMILGQLEHSEGRSFVDDDFRVNLVSDVGYVVFAACVSGNVEFGAAALALLMIGRTLATLCKYTNGQQLPHSGVAVSNPTYKRLWTNGYDYIPDFDPGNPPTFAVSESDILFLQIHCGDGAHCGAMKIVTVSRLWFTDWGTYPIGQSYAVKLTTTFIVPYFVKN